MSIFSPHISRSGKRGLPAGQAGFTLIELLVVASIVVIITSVLLVRQSRFNSSTILRSLAYSVALSVRQAQVYGVSVLGTSNSGALTYAPAYGLYFVWNSPSSYILFADFNNNNVYDSSTETVKVFSLSPGYAISEVCAKRTNGSIRCTGPHDSSGIPSTNTVLILFKRPNPDATFATSISGEQYVSGWIQLRSQNGATRSVLVTAAGQISVQPPGTLP